jgi:hypothetical protein
MRRIILFIRVTVDPLLTLIASGTYGLAMSGLKEIHSQL